MGTSPPQLPLELVCSSEHSLQQVRWLVMQKALQIIKGPQGKLLQGGRLPWVLSLAVGLLGAAQATREAQETLRLLISVFSAWLCPFFSPSEQRLRVGGTAEENFPEFPCGAGCPRSALAPYVRGKGRSRLSPGSWPGEQMAVQRH